MLSCHCSVERCVCKSNICVSVFILLILYGICGFNFGFAMTFYFLTNFIILGPISSPLDWKKACADGAAVYKETLGSCILWNSSVHLFTVVFGLIKSVVFLSWFISV